MHEQSALLSRNFGANVVKSRLEQGKVTQFGVGDKALCGSQNDAKNAKRFARIVEKWILLAILG